jgi:hypothetical protein
MQTLIQKPFYLIVLIVIIFIVLYVFFKPKREEKEAQESPKKINNEDSNYYLPAIVAAISLMMEGKDFTIKRVVVTGDHEKFSSWRLFGRQEIMRRRTSMQE